MHMHEMAAQATYIWPATQPPARRQLKASYLAERNSPFEKQHIGAVGVGRVEVWSAVEAGIQPSSLARRAIGGGGAG